MAIELFFSYSHKDEELRNKLANHLSMLRRQGVINPWHDREITAGTEWRGAIDEHLESADIILLLISADFLASDYCWEVEMRRAMQRHEAGEARVIPVILRRVDLDGAPFGELKPLPNDAVPVTSSSWFNLDEAFTNIAEGIRRVASEIEKHKSGPVPLPIPEPIPPPEPKPTVVYIDLGSDACLGLVTIPSGTFKMGPSDSEVDRKENELPQHEVTIQSFSIGLYPITQAQWQAVASYPQIERTLEPVLFRGEGNSPIVQVSWHDAVEFCARLSKENQREYRLPSEAEWEYACRAGTETRFYFGETITSEQAHYNQKATNSVGRFLHNAFGLYDLHGNVWEWCEDIWHENYENAPRDGNAWTIEGDQSKRVLRGGSWRFDLRRCRSASRYWYLTDRSNNDIGFRIVCSVVSQQ